MATEIGTAYVLIEPTAKGLGGKIENEMNGIGEKSGNSFAKGFGKIIGGAAVAGTAAVSAFAKSAINAGSSFDESMSQVAATMGTTVDKISELRDFAQEMGSTTAFSASEAADALNYMALAGYDAETSMKMLPNVLNLAAAGGIELAQASDMITDASSALGLSLDDTAKMVDQMATASSKSNTSVEQLGQAILTVGGTAKSLKGGTTELATALGILADNGTKGAEGGTALRNVLLGIQSDKFEKTFGDLGVSAYDAEGNLRDLKDVFIDMNAAMEGMTDKEKTDIISSTFNKVDLKNVNALLDTSVERWDELSAAINNAEGAAGAMAETQLDNLAGDITLFKSALEGAQIAISDQLTPTLREFVSFGAEGLGQLTQAFNEGGLDGAMDALGRLLADGLNMLIEKLPVVIEAGMKLVSALGQGILQNLPTILQSAISIVLELAKGLIEALPELIPTIADIIVQIALMLTDPDTLTSLIMAAADIIIAFAEGLVKAVPQLIEALPTIITNLVSALIDLAPQLLIAAAKLMLTLAEGLIREFIAIKNAVVELWDKLKNLWSEKIGDVKKWGRDLIDNFIGGIKEKWESFKQTLSDLATTVKDFLGFSVPEKGPLHEWAFNNPGYDMVELFTEGMQNAQPNLETALSQDIAAPMYNTMAGGENGANENGAGTQNWTIRLEGDAAKLFTFMVEQNRVYKRMNGESAFA